MTGVEAVSNGVPLFRKPAVRLARRTLTLIVVILGCLIGVSRSSYARTESQRRFQGSLDISASCRRSSAR